MEAQQIKNVDESQVKITLPVTIAFAVGLAMIVGTGLASYYGNRLAIERNFSDIKERITKVEAVTVRVPTLEEEIADYRTQIAGLREGMWILLRDRGYDPDKILGKKNGQ